MILSSMLDDALTNILHYYRKFVAADVWMGVNENRWVCTETHKLMKNLADITSL